jgi:hypothetical protein
MPEVSPPGDGGAQPASAASSASSATLPGAGSASRCPRPGGQQERARIPQRAGNERCAALPGAHAHRSETIVIEVPWQGDFLAKFFNNLPLRQASRRCSLALGVPGYGPPPIRKNSLIPNGRWYFDPGASIATKRLVRPVTMQRGGGVGADTRSPRIGAATCAVRAALVADYTVKRAI